ncbi:hypothetical protein F4801DRAFT_602305 [Xylaria longipes]|nr:hypothetical protein F4801DRAFT_602305 [Xylaria longipes]
MSSQDVEDAVAEVAQLLDDLKQGHVDVNQLKSDLKQREDATKEIVGALRRRRDVMKDRIDQLASQKRQLEEQTAKLKDDSGKFDMAKWRKATESYKQTRFNNALHWLIAKDKDETLDRLRDMSPDHKAATLDLERQITVAKLDIATESLRLKEAEVSKVTSELDSMSNDIRAFDKDKKSLETRVADLESSEKILQQRHDTVTAQHNAALNKVGTLSRRVRELGDEICEKTDRLAAQASEVTRLTAANKNLQDHLTRKDAEISELNSKSDAERTGHENTERQLLEAELAGRHLRREVYTLHELIAEGLAEIDRLEDEVKDTSDALKGVRERSAEYYLCVVMKKEEIFELKQDVARKDTDLAQANADLLRNKANLEQKNAELEHMKEDRARKNTDLSQCITTLERKEADVKQRDTNLARLLMGHRQREQDVDRWLPLINSLQLPMPATQPTIERYRWWTMAPSWEQQKVSPTSAWPRGLLESVALLYGQAVANKWDEDGCVAFTTIIRGLEVAEVAPVAMIMELLRRLLTTTTQDYDSSHRTQIGLPTVPGRTTAAVLRGHSVHVQKPLASPR